MTALNPTIIVIRRETRQRRELDDVAELRESIRTIGQINPITVRRDGDDIILIAGERRLRACLELQRDVLVQFWENIDEISAKEIEAEENLKREDLPWRDKVRALGELHELRLSRNNTWTVVQTANRMSLHDTYMYRVLAVYKNLDSKLLADSTGVEHAYGVLQRQSERRAAAIVGELASAGAEIFGNLDESAVKSGSNPPFSGAGEGSGSPTAEITNTSPPAPSTTTASVRAAPPPRSEPDCILNTSFLTWAPVYTGPKFNLIHCDFPYGIKFTGGYGQEEDGIKYESTEDGYWELVNCLCTNLNRFASYSSHVLFWFSMNFYTETKRRLESAGLKVQDHPLIWYKSDGQGIVPGRNEYPRRIYETAFLCSLGKRPLVKMFDNTYACPRTQNGIHPSTKPESMLRYFFSGLIDSTTDMLDPTCGGATALRAAEDVGARSILGLELDSDFYKSALAATNNARLLRKAAL